MGKNTIKTEQSPARYVANAPPEGPQDVGREKKVQSEKLFSEDFPDYVV